MFVRRSDMENREEWAQQEEYIENKEASSHGFTSMILRREWRGDFRISAGMAFMERMAPSIVLAWGLGSDAQNHPEYREFIEIVLWDGGVNCWLHSRENDKPVWVKSVYCRFPIEKEIRHQLEVARKGKELAITVGEHSFGYHVDVLPDDLSIGVTAAEGINRLYDFTLREP